VEGQKIPALAAAQGRKWAGGRNSVPGSFSSMTAPSTSGQIVIFGFGCGVNRDDTFKLHVTRVSWNDFFSLFDSIL
jgi:hypothetical protein